MSRFEKLHPLYQLVFFLVSLIIPICAGNPFFSTASLVGALAYSFVRNGAKAFKTLACSVLVIIAVGVFNMLFAHYGQDDLFMLGDIHFTFQALFFGLNQGVILSSVFIWFTFFGRILDSERIIYLFRFAPKIALTFSIVLGFIPRFLKKLGDIKTARLALSGGEREVSLKGRFKEAVSDFSALVSYALEAGIITADSMSSRNYNPRAVSPKRFHFTKSDIVLIILNLASFLYIILVKLNGDISFIFEPETYSKRLSIPALAVFILLELSVSFIDLKENYRWKKSRVKV